MRNFPIARACQTDLGGMDDKDFWTRQLRRVSSPIKNEMETSDKKFPNLKMPSELFMKWGPNMRSWEEYLDILSFGFIPFNLHRTPSILFTTQYIFAIFI